MEKEKLERINALARKQREVGLDEAEKAEEYIAEFRASMGGILDNTYIQRPDGTKEKIKKTEK